MQNIRYPPLSFMVPCLQYLQIHPFFVHGQFFKKYELIANLMCLHVLSLVTIAALSSPLWYHIPIILKVNCHWWLCRYGACSAAIAHVDCDIIIDLAVEILGLPMSCMNRFGSESIGA